MAEQRLKAEEAQDAQFVFGDPLRRITDKPDPSRRQIGPAAGRIIQMAIAIGIDGIDGEIAPRRIQAPILREGDLGVTAKVFHIHAQGRDLKFLLSSKRRNGAVFQARRDNLDAVFFQKPHVVFGQLIDRDIQIGARPAQQSVAHAAPNQPRCGPRRPQGP